ncbi:MAG TPA: MFS transporter [Blastocatellia bacterium]|nr:MFS transporter [Blastocatellia bacterium]
MSSYNDTATMNGSPVAPSESRKEQVGWYFYDWANSAFSTTVVTVFLGPYLTTIAKSAADGEGYIHPFGVKMLADSFYPAVISISVLFQFILLPVLGAVSDFSHLKKQMFGFFAYVGAFASMGLYFLEGTNYMLGGILFIVSNLSFGASVVFYNSFLPEIAPPDRRDHVSSMGWALGYIGGGLLLALNLVMFSKADWFGLTQGQAVRISLASAGLWWAIFTLIPLAALKKRQPARALPPGEGYISAGIKQLRHTVMSARGYPQTVLFLVAYLIYNDGIQTVITLCSQFGQEELGLSISTLTTVVLMAQFVGYFGNLIFNWLAAKIGAKRAVMISLVIWSGALIYVYAFLHNSLHFYILGAVIALVMGGSQALSRSLYSQMIPKTQEAEYFSLYEVSDKGTSWLGPAIFGFALHFTRSYRSAILSLVIFFIVGLVLLSMVNVRKAALEAGNQAPSGE